MSEEKKQRPRITKGILVASTNAIQQSCIRSLTIAHYYNPLNYNRIKRVVIN